MISMKLMKNYSIICTVFILLASMASCQKDDQKPNDMPLNHDMHDEELITTLILTLEDTSGVQPTVTATFRDIDGPGGLAPTAFDTIYLKTNTTYTCSIALWNESLDPVENITHEVMEEADEHLFCFTISDAQLQIIRTDSDGQYEIGLSSQWTVGSASSGHVQVALKHQPGVKNGSCDPGETDIELLFSVLVED
jgi:hypothetical protein